MPGSYSDQQEESADEKRCARYGMSCDDISLDVITISRWLSADGLMLMMSSVTSSYSADGLREQSQDSADPVQARRRKTLVYVVSHTAAAVVHLWSLGVLTAAGCGIGSVHAVVRSNLLVEPSEVEEGEM
ncbi:cysteine protease [Dorcoceras hygrometricum]|uniref:Cysteine protease n=1 Tax=Dorcoceras hygrometricum TaxID=472368 RepID=A0A2Z7A971_9LAMI|nr:cysteine protease [Dorcoceras hygrometricum]